MTAVHLSTRGGILCRSTRRNPRCSTDLQFVTCAWCVHTLERVTRYEDEALFQRQADARWSEAATILGVSEFWESLPSLTPSDRLIRSVLGSVFVGLVESREQAVGAA